MTVDHHTLLEEAVFRVVNSGGGRVLDLLMVTLSARWFGFLFGALLAVAIARGRRRLWLLLALGLALLLSDFVGAQVLRPLFGRMRPCYALPPGTIRWLAPAANVGSIPSLHAANFTALAGVAWAASRRLGLAALAVALLVAVSRVYVGVHWPLDVLAGVLWGAFCALAALGLSRRLLAPRPPGGTRHQS